MEILFWILICVLAPALAMIIVPAGIALAEIAGLIVGIVALLTVFTGLFKNLNEKITKYVAHNNYVKAKRKKEQKCLNELENITSELDEDQQYIINYYLK